MKRVRIDLKEDTYPKKYVYVEGHAVHDTWIENENENSFTVGTLGFHRRHDGEFIDETAAWDDEALVCVDTLGLEDWVDESFIDAAEDDSDWMPDCRTVFTVKRRKNGELKRQAKCCYHTFYLAKKKEMEGKYLTQDDLDEKGQKF